MIYQNLILAIVLFPLLGALVAGLGGQTLSPRMAHRAAILGVALSFALSLLCAYQFFFVHGSVAYNAELYLWGSSDQFRFQLGFLVDSLTLLMLLVVNFVSLIVHIYSMIYMADDPGYKRFFSYMSAFTFAMLVLVSANNFLQLYFGWEAVGLLSYLLIGFWFKRESANAASLKAFIVNRVGDFGFLLGIALVLNYFKSLNYTTVFHQASQLQTSVIELFPGVSCSVITLICLLLFVGAMGKSAQMPLHVWLPDSMEGPTPISALIHAATMVTAGVYLVARLSPLYEYSSTVLNLILLLGASTALWMGLLAVVQNDIKRVIAYSTLSQLGYMMAALGASAYAAGMFHLVTHAFFKALLFLAAGSVILLLHHEQNMREMGGLAKFIPITYITFLVGALALAAVPPFSGFYSKDAIIEAVRLSPLPSAHYAYACVVITAFVTAFYIFRAFFLVFHGRERLSVERKKQLHKTSVWVEYTLFALAIPSLIAGYLLQGPFLGKAGFLTTVLFVLPTHHSVISPAMTEMSAIREFLIHYVALFFSLLGILVAWLCYNRFPRVPDKIQRCFPWLYQILIRKYGFDQLYQTLFAEGGRRMAEWFFKADAYILDQRIIDGSTRRIAWFSALLRRLQSGYLYDYTWIMLLGVVGLLLVLGVYRYVL